jgi:predicted ATPase/class 3 adenylate cyclase
MSFALRRRADEPVALPATARIAHQPPPVDLEGSGTRARGGRRPARPGHCAQFLDEAWRFPIGLRSAPRRDPAALAWLRLSGDDLRLMRHLPTGTVTFLFTDVEGSTRLIQRSGDYATLLERHRILLREACAGGVEFGSAGDALFFAFSDAAEAIRAATYAQRAMESEMWPDGQRIRVRIGVHTGPVEVVGEDYVGVEVHRVARIASSAHGGQVVVSEATRLSAGAGMPLGVSVHDLGWHRLKDIEAPEHLYQLMAAGLATQFPPVKSLGAPTSLPLPPTPLVGRDHDVEQLRLLILQPAVHLVTMTGVGGVGKTRLALAAASSMQHDFPNGVFFIPLAPVGDAAVMWGTIAESLGVSDDRPPAVAVTEHLHSLRSLLVLDNLEQVDEASYVVTELVAAAPAVALLVTSRSPLHVEGEHEWPVSALALPAQPVPGPDDLKDSSAASLFVQHATMVSPSFTVTAENAADIGAICRHLDGLPLAIEIAAARAKLLTPKAVRARLGERLSLAAGNPGRPRRHLTLRDTIAWSYDLLAPGLQQAFRRTGVFAGGCDLDAFAAVALAGGALEAQPDQLGWATQLLDASLIAVTEGVDGEPRLHMLETIRMFALERLAQEDDLEVSQHRHAVNYLALAERARAGMQDPAYWIWLDRLEIEHDNLRAALDWSLSDTVGGPGGNGQTTIGLQLVQALAPFWYQHGHAKEAQHWLERAVEVAPSTAGAPLAHVCHWLGVFREQRGEGRAAIPLLHQSLTIWRGLGDQHEVAVELNSLGVTHRSVGDLETAVSFFEQSIVIAREIEDDFRLSTALSNLGVAEIDAGNVGRATKVLEEALALDRAAGRTWGATIVSISLAAANLIAGRTVEAHQLVLSAAEDVERSGDLDLLASTFELAAGIAAHVGDGQRAARLAGAAEAVREKAGIPMTGFDAALLERLLTPARTALEPQAWDAERNTGRSLMPDKAVALMMQAPASSSSR